MGRPPCPTAKSYSVIRPLGVIFWGPRRPGGLPSGSVEKNLPASAGDARDSRLIPGLGRRSPGEGNGNLLQYSCLGNPTDRGVWWAIVHGITKTQI